MLTLALIVVAAILFVKWPQMSEDQRKVTRIIVTILIAILALILVAGLVMYVVSVRPDSQGPIGPIEHAVI